MSPVGFRHRLGAGLPRPRGGVGAQVVGAATPLGLTLGGGCSARCPSLVGDTERLLCPTGTLLRVTAHPHPGVLARPPHPAAHNVCLKAVQIHSCRGHLARPAWGTLTCEAGLDREGLGLGTFHVHTKGLLFRRT